MDVQSRPPLVVVTWAKEGFQQITHLAFKNMLQTGERMNSIIMACSKAEEMQLDGSIGYGNHPDEQGRCCLDALVIDGTTQSVGSVASLRGVRNAVGVAAAVANRTKHTLLCGEKATEFALHSHFKAECTESDYSNAKHRKWLENNKMPNFWKNNPSDITRVNVVGHDTICMMAIDSRNDISVATSSNGAEFKIPGRVGDACIVGSGAFVDNDVGAAVASGDGDVMMRFAPSAMAVGLMASGKSPKEACATVIRRIAAYYPDFQGVVIAVTKDGLHGGAANCLHKPAYSYQGLGDESVKINQL